MRCGRGVAPKPHAHPTGKVPSCKPGTWSALDPGLISQAWFLPHLRARRDSAAIGNDERAVRVDHPSDVLRGSLLTVPCLPGLPILTAYVRACEGDVLDGGNGGGALTLRWQTTRIFRSGPLERARPRWRRPRGRGCRRPRRLRPGADQGRAPRGPRRSGRDSRRASDQGISALAAPRRRAQRRTCSSIPARAGTRCELGGERELGHVLHPASPRPTGTTRPSTPAAGRSRRVHRLAGSRRAHRTRAGPGLLMGRRQPTGIPAGRTGRPRRRVAGAGER